MLSFNHAFNFAYQQTVKIIPAIVPIVVGKAIEISLQDKRIASLATGVGLIGSGIYMMASSGITKLLGKNNQTGHATETAFNQAKRIGLTLAGFTATACGVYLVFSTLFQLYSKDPSIAACEIELENAKKEIFSCPEAKKLWNDVKEQGDFTIKCMSSSEAKSQGRVNIASRTLYVSNHREEGIEPSTMSDVVTFELNNLNRAKVLDKHYENICDMDPDQWAIEAEKLELGTLTATQEVVASCKERGGWTGDMDIRFPNPEEALAEQEASGHTDAYRLTWIKRCAPDMIKEAVEWLRMQSAVTGKQLPPNIDWYG